MDWSSVWESLQAAGWPGVVVGLLVLVFVFLGEFTNVFKGGTLKRLAAVISSYLFAGVRPGDEQSALVGAIGLVLATIGHLLYDAIMAELEKRKAKK